MTKWISVKDELPSKGNAPAITYSNKSGVCTGIWYDWDKKKWFTEDRDCESIEIDDVITHWQPFPESPEDEKLREMLTTDSQVSPGRLENTSLYDVPD